jgi:hypothetical protein
LALREQVSDVALPWWNWISRSAPTGEPPTETFRRPGRPLGLPGPEEVEAALDAPNFVDFSNRWDKSEEDTVTCRKRGSSFASRQKTFAVVKKFELV